MSRCLDHGERAAERRILHTNVLMVAPHLEEQMASFTNRDAHDPLVLVRERLARLLEMLRVDPPTIDKIQTLQELGFLSEHSLSEGMTNAHERVRCAIDEAMTSGWE
jgi:hypothetical protein